MQSFGAGSVEVFDTNQSYHLKSGAFARLTIPVDPTQRSIAGKRRNGVPDTIPFLLYNEIRGAWGQQSQARLNSDRTAKEFGSLKLTPIILLFVIFVLYLA